ncbi:MAG: GtrA family protein [Bacteroidales bacterium]
MQLLNRGIAYLYLPFTRIISFQIFKYLFCGGVNTILDAGLYHFFHFIILGAKDVQIFGFNISSHIFAFLIVFPLTFFTGFLLTKMIVFPGSNMKVIIQFSRFAITIISSLIIQYFSLKLLIEVLLFHPTISKLAASAIAAVFTFISHKYFSFK